MKKLFKEFKDFINRGNALALAIGVIIGGAFSSVVGAINSKIISPLIGLLIGNADLSNSLITVLKTDAEGNVTNAIYWGAFLQAVIDFILIALILFIISKIVLTVVAKAKEVVDKGHDEEVVVASEPEPEPVKPATEVLLEEIRDLLKEEKNAK